LNVSLASLPEVVLPQILLIPKSGTLLKHFVPFLQVNASSFLYPKLDSIITSHPEQTLKEGLSSRELLLAEQRGRGMYRLTDVIPEIVTGRQHNFLQNAAPYRAEKRVEDYPQLQTTTSSLPLVEEYRQPTVRSSDAVVQFAEQRSPQIMAEEFIQPFSRINNMSGQPAEQKEVFRDLDGRSFYDSHLKLNSKFVDQTIDNNVLTRQFPSVYERDDYLGTQTYTFNIDFFHRKVMVRQGLEVILDKLEKVLNNVDSFKSACLWKWTGAGQQGISLDMFTKNEIRSVEDILVAVRNLELFQSTVFGECWKNCTRKFIDRIALSGPIATLEPKYVQFEFEKACQMMHDLLRMKAENMEEIKWGEYYANQFSTLLLEKVDPCSSGQVVWNFFHNKDNMSIITSPAVEGSRKRDDTVKSSGSSVCFRFLRKALNVTEMDGTPAKGCTTPDCGRKHSELFGMSRENIIQQLRNAPNGNNLDLIEAVTSSNKFK
jgi:hypothetical protein